MTGLKPVKYASGAPYNGAGNFYFIPASDSTGNVYVGDPVALGGSGDTVGDYQTVTNATLAANNGMCGVVLGIYPATRPPDLTTLPNQEIRYRPDDTAAYIYVADDPNLVFEVGEDADSAALVAADFGNLGILVAGTDSTTYGTSGNVLDSSSFASDTANGQFVLMGKVSDPSKSLGDTGVKFYVKWNHPQHQLVTGGT